MWDDRDTVRRYEEWFDTRAGAFALSAERRLVEFLVSGWPRRGSTFLDVGCGPGLMLEMLYESGFDVTGLDASPAMLAAAHARMDGRAELQVGNAEHLPYDDNHFDYVSLLTVLEFVDDPQLALAEACRVAARGVVVTMLNRWSLYYLSHGKRGALRKAHWYTPVALRAMLRKAADKRPFTMRSVLPGPFVTWREAMPWGQLNSMLLPYGLGSYMGVRVDMCHLCGTATPLMARAGGVGRPKSVVASSISPSSSS